ncbi:MAG: hypothetical protein R2883_01130 [Caldisericia bacterium]
MIKNQRINSDVTAGTEKTLKFSVLSDFENLCLYDVRIQPKEIDHPYAARLVMYGYQDYIKNGMAEAI